MGWNRAYQLKQYLLKVAGEQWRSSAMARQARSLGSVQR